MASNTAEHFVVTNELVGQLQESAQHDCFCNQRRRNTYSDKHRCL